MRSSHDKTRDKTNGRRKFLRMLAGSPLLVSGGLIYGPLAELLAAEAPDHRRAFALLDDIAQGADLISSPSRLTAV